MEFQLSFLNLPFVYAGKENVESSMKTINLFFKTYDRQKVPTFDIHSMFPRVFRLCWWFFQSILKCVVFHVIPNQVSIPSICRGFSCPNRVPLFIMFFQLNLNVMYVWHNFCATIEFPFFTMISNDISNVSWFLHPKEAWKAQTHKFVQKSINPRGNLTTSENRRNVFSSRMEDRKL